MAVASVQAPVPGRADDRRRMSSSHSRYWARNTGSDIALESWRRCTASGPSYVASSCASIHLYPRNPGQSSVTPWPPIRLTASRITAAPWPVFQSFTAGPSTDATASSITKRASGSCATASTRSARRAAAGLASSARYARASFSAGSRARRSARPGATPCPAKYSSFARSSGSSSSNTRAAANPSDAAASPDAQTSTSLCSASSSCCSPSSKRRDPGCAAPPPRNRPRW